MEAESRAQVIVVGAGIAGLATAYRIEEHLRAVGSAAQVRVLEAGARPGGKVQTVIQDGFVFEGGPNGFLDNEPATLRLIDDLGLHHELLPSRELARRRFVIRNGRFHLLATHPFKFLTSSVLSLRGRLRVVAEMWTRPRRDDADESVAAFGRRRLGREFADVLLDALVSGIHAGDPDALSLRAAFPKVHALEREHGGLIRGMRARRKTAGGQKVEAGPSGVLHAFRGGMETPVKALAGKLGDRVMVRHSVQQVRSDGQRAFTVVASGPDGEATFEADAVVLATPAPATAGALGSLDPDAAAALADVPIAGVHVVCQGYRRDQVHHPLDGFGALIPHVEGRPILGTLWSAAAFDGYAPDSHVQLRTLVGGSRNPGASDLDDDALVDLVRRETRRDYGITGDAVATRVFRWPRGIPQYTVGHLGRMTRVRAATDRLRGLFVTGNSVCGISFNHCVADAERTALAVAVHLEKSGVRGP
ncbi:MAG: protoporphyrinogen oxidase [Planctomycetes bacterium]|nr:protoporphyrinogen oxidase [Planctomycetota bacterium]